MFNPVAPYQYLFSNMYLSVADITNPDILGCCCQTWIVLTSPAFLRSSARHTAGPYGRLGKNVNQGLKGSTQFAQRIARPL